MRSLFWLVGIAGCSETGVKQIKTGTLEVDPPSISIEGSCSYEEHVVTLSSVGDHAVTVESLSLQGDGWAMLSSPSLPLVLEPGRQAEVVLLGQEGEARLRVASDDPEALVQDILLAGTPNAPPALAWVSPAEGAAVDPGELLVVEVSDGQDAPIDLVVSWSSDVDGALGAGIPDDLGQTGVAWGEATGGDHRLSATVTDSCGASTTVERGVCRQAGYASDSLDLSTWSFEGSARYDSDEGWVELTSLSPTFQLGSAFQTTETRGDNVRLAFSFYVSGGTGADGFAVTALDTTRATSTLAHPGGCLGYGGGPVCGGVDPLYGWTIEVDTFFSPDVDPTPEDHISFHFDGNVVGYEAYAVLPEMEDDSWHDMVIDVVAPRVTVSIDGVVYLDEEMEGDFDFPALVGFTAATGGETNYHRIDSLTVIENLCEE